MAGCASCVYMRKNLLLKNDKQTVRIFGVTRLLAVRLYLIAVNVISSLISVMNTLAFGFVRHCLVHTNIVWSCVGKYR